MKIIREQGYFHTGNSGLTISITENKDKYSHNFRLECQHGAFGSYSKFSIPISGPNMIQYLIDALTNTKEYIEGLEEFTAEYAFQDESMTNPWIPVESEKIKIINDKSPRIDYENSLRIEFETEEIFSEDGKSSERYIIAKKYFDNENNLIQKDEYLDKNPMEKCIGGSSSS